MSPLEQASAQLSQSYDAALFDLDGVVYIGRDAVPGVVDAINEVDRLGAMRLTYVSNNAGDLMKSPHPLGFEIVHKNTENTRMAAVFAFRINKDLLYAPCFFLNGTIKGTDLLYRHCAQRPSGANTCCWLTMS